jgi:hypothetical protein
VGDGLDDTDSLFDRLVQKQAGRELEQAGEEGLTDDLINSMSALFQELKAKGKAFDEEMLNAYRKEGVTIPVELAIMAGFLQGIALPLLATDEVKTDSLGELGICLYANAQLFSFWDASEKCVCNPPVGHEWWSRLTSCQRFSVQFGRFMKEAFSWEACSSSMEKGGLAAIEVTWDGLWVGERAKTQLQYWARLGCQKAKLVHNMARLEQIEFELQMRKSFGMEST